MLRAYADMVDKAMIIEKDITDIQEIKTRMAKISFTTKILQEINEKVVT